MSLIEFTLLALSSLFVIVDPIATVPAFLAMTPNESPSQRIRTARLACGVATIVLVLFALTGSFLFRFLGITLPAFQIAASIILLLVALDMLQARRSAVVETPAETTAGTAKEEVAITPLAVPMLAGPGAISTVILLQGRAAGDFRKQAALVGCILVVSAAAYLVFVLSSKGARWLSPIALRITVRVMGLLLAAIAMQFLLNALREVKLVEF
jgi:multiple antibiotic resistance protein